MKTYIPISGLLLSAVAISLVSCHDKNKKTEEDSIKTIDVAVATTDSIVLHKTYPGYLAANKTVEVVGQVDGKLLTKSFESGKYVNKGQVLFTIDPTLYQDAVNRAEAELASAISARDYAKSHYDAVKKALEADAVSKMEVLSAESSYNQAEANIKDCQAALHTAKTNLGYCTIHAPMSGYISDAYLSVGNFISGSASPVALAKIYDNGTLFAIFEIEDSQYEHIVGKGGGINSPVYRSIPLKFSDNLKNNYTADLWYESPAVEKGTGTIELKGSVKNVDNELKEGMYVTVSLPYGISSNAVLVKDAALSTDQLGKYLYVVNDSNKVVYTPVEVGELYQDSLRVINKGIKGGEKYVTKALLSVRNGEEVKPVVEK